MNLSNDSTDIKMSVMRASKLDNISYEELAKFVNERLVTVKDSLAKICAAFSVYLKKMSSLRNATDDLAFVLYEYASKEKINKSLKSHILQFSELLASVGDCRDTEVKQLDSQLLKEIRHYQLHCVNARAEVKSILRLKEKEISNHKQLQKLRSRNPYNREQIIKAEASLSEAVGSIATSLKGLEEHINHFEKKKLQDIKCLLLKFITIEIAQHSNAIQLLTKSYNEISNINVHTDLHEFESVMKTNLSQNSLGMKIPIKQLNLLQNNAQDNTKGEDSINKPDLKYELKHQQFCIEAVQSNTDISTSDSYSVTGKDRSTNS